MVEEGVDEAVDEGSMKASMTEGANEGADEGVNEGVDERSMSVSRDTEAEVHLQGHEELDQQGERAKHKHQKHKEETLY